MERRDLLRGIIKTVIVSPLNRIITNTELFAKEHSSKKHLYINIDDLGAVGDGVTDDTSVFQFALDNYKSIEIPNKGRSYVIKKQLTIPKLTKLYSKSKVKPKLVFKGDLKVCVYMKESCVIDNLEIDGDISSKNNGSVAILMQESRAELTKSRIINGKCCNVLLQGNSCKITDCDISLSLGSGIAMRGKRCFSNVVENVSISSNEGFGIWITQGAYNNYINNCLCEKNRLEFCGITFSAHDNHVNNNKVIGSRDNGISVTGYRNYIENNICMYNNYHGIGVQGESNQIKNNYCYNNGQKNRKLKKELTYSGIALVPCFGGFARFNEIIGNICKDTQHIKTQIFGIKIEKSQYRRWKAGSKVSVNKRYVENNGNIYYANKPIIEEKVTGPNKPIHNSGTEGDGNVAWKWIGSKTRSFDGAFSAWKIGQVLIKSYSRKMYKNKIYLSGFNGVAKSPPREGNNNLENWEVICDLPKNLDAFCNYIKDNECYGNKNESLSKRSKNINLIEECHVNGLS
jgi:hypothetical protein